MSADASDADDLGFTWRALKAGEVEVRHHGKLAATLRGSDASDFLGDMQGASFADGQQSMARLTGNYKHGNERLAASHPRNKR